MCEVAPLQEMRAEGAERVRPARNEEVTTA